MKMIAQNAKKVQMADTISHFIKRFQVGNLLKAWIAYKEKSVSVVRLFMYKLQMVFADRSMYMQLQTGRWMEGFSKNTFYRFLNSVKVNWERFNALLAARIINEAMKPLTNEDRKDVFIVDDTLYRRQGYKKTERCAAVIRPHGHEEPEGTPAADIWLVGRNTFIPIGQRLLSSPMTTARNMTICFCLQWYLLMQRTLLICFLIERKLCSQPTIC